MANDKMTLAQHAFEPGNMGEAMTLARTLVASRLLPKSVGTPEAAFTIIMAGRELGLTAMQAIRSLYVIEGRPTMSADLMAALVKRSEECEFFRPVQSTNEVAVYETKRRGEPEPTRMAFTLEDAKAAGLVTKDNWRKFPAAMLRARCIAALARAVYPDTMLGIYESDELAPGTGAPPYVAPAAPSVPEAEVVPDYAESSAAASNFAIGIDAAQSSAELAEVAKAIAASARQGVLSPDDRRALGERYTARKAALAAETPTGEEAAQ